MNYVLVVLLSAISTFVCARCMKPAIFPESTFSAWLRSKQGMVYTLLGLVVGLLAASAKLYWSGNLLGASMNLLCMEMLYAMAVSDAKIMKIPNHLCLFGLGIVLIKPIVYIVKMPESALAGALSMLIGGLLGGGIFFICALIKPGSVGMGDVKIFGLLGMIYGFSGCFSLILMSLLLVLPVAIVMLIRKKAGRTTKYAMAPYIAASALIHMLSGLI